MVAANEVKTILVNGGLGSILVGGIYTYTETGKFGINSRKTPNAFDPTTKMLRPCAVIKERSKVPDFMISDLDKNSYTQVVEIYLYQDGDGDDDEIMQAVGICFDLLHGKKLQNGILHWQYTLIGERDDALNGAHLARIDFSMFAIQQ